MGQLSIANLNLVRRFELDAPLSQHNPSIYDAEGETGYTDYSVLEMAA